MPRPYQQESILVIIAFVWLENWRIMGMSYAV